MQNNPKHPKAWWKTLATVALAVWTCVPAMEAGAAEVKNVTAKYAWPWGVHINYEVSGTLASVPPFVVMATDRTSGATYTAAASSLSGDMGTAAGKHQLVWDLDKQGIKLQSTNVVFTVMIAPLYCVIDLSAGANASSYPVTYMDVPPSGGFNTDVYKTTKLVLRRIEPGTFMMGSPTNDPDVIYNNEDQHQVTLTKPYYIGLFEVTQKQWQLVTGSNPSQYSGDKRPVEKVSWDTIRGNSSTYNWPGSSAVDANSFIGRIQKRTGLAFDLPTEAQWEYACRAGTTTAYSYGASANGDYMWYDSNSSSQTHDVGSKNANAWGLYDMHGNVWERCLDWYAKSLGTAAVTDPKGASSGSNRMTRGGCWDGAAAYCRSAYRGHSNPSYASSGQGFRLSRTVSE